MDIIGNGCPSFMNYGNPKSLASKFKIDLNLARFFQRYLLQKTFSVFKWTLPGHWSIEYFLHVLYGWGYIAIVKTDKFGVIPQGCGLRGYDVFYRPTNAVIVNPLLRGITEPRIGKECVLLKLAPDFGGVMDLVEYYGSMMALAAQTAGANLSNSKLSYIFSASTKAAADSFKTMHDKIANGELSVVVDKALFNSDGSPNWTNFTQNVGQNYIADKLFEDLRKLEQRFDTAIGIPNANTDKKERLIVDEVNANNVETVTLCELWLEELKKGCAEANKMFGIEMGVDWRHKPIAQSSERGVANGDNSGTV